jgi:hypothetical protein
MTTLADESKTKIQDFITIKWHVEDVQEKRPDLSNEQAIDVLNYIQRNHDANTGINWEVIEYAADDLFPEPDDLDELRRLRDDSL